MMHPQFILIHAAALVAACSGTTGIKVDLDAVVDADAETSPSDAETSPADAEVEPESPDACPTATISATPSGTHCADEDVVLDAGEHDTYLWSTGAATRTITVTTDATYTVHVTDAGGCSADAQYVVDSSPLPVAVDAMDVGEPGVKPKLIPSPEGDRMYLFFSSPDAKVMTFDVASESWLPEVLVAPGTANTLVRWIGQGYAVDPAGNLHVAWGEGTSACPGDIPTYVRHVAFNGTTWGDSETLAERVPGDPVCGFQNVAMASDGSGRLVVVYQVPTMVDEDPNHAIHPKKYRIHDGSAWSGELQVGSTTHAGDVTAGGGVGSFYIGYMVPGGAVDTEIALILPGSTAISEATRLSGPGVDHAATFLVEASGTAHAVWQMGDKFDDAYGHASGIFYNHREGETWMEGDPGTRLVCAAFFGHGNPVQEEEAWVHMAKSPSGTKLVVFTYMTELYFIVGTDEAWGSIHSAEIDVDAGWAYPIALGSTDRFLVVWSTREYQWRESTLHYVILQV
jgi:hypothetical protein